MYAKWRHCHFISLFTVYDFDKPLPPPWHSTYYMDAPLNKKTVSYFVTGCISKKYWWIFANAHETRGSKKMTKQAQVQLFIMEWSLVMVSQINDTHNMAIWAILFCKVEEWMHYAVPSIYMNQLLLFSSPDLPRRISDNFHGKNSQNCQLPKEFARDKMRSFYGL